MEERIKCLLVEPYKLPKLIEIENTLEAKQKIVDGMIETIYLTNDDSVVLICNEEGKINGLRLNRDIGHDIIAGPFLVVGNDYKNSGFKSLTEEQILKYKLRFDENSVIQTENRINAILLNRAKNKYER